MTSITMERYGDFPFKGLFFILLIGLVILAVVIGTSISHGALKHATYPQAIQCYNDGKYTLNFFDSGNRYIQFCMINKSTFAIRVLEKVTDGKYEELTAYIQKGERSETQ